MPSQQSLLLIESWTPFSFVQLSSQALIHDLVLETEYSPVRIPEELVCYREGYDGEIF